MKNLNLNNYGVQEMNAEEMREINGGWEWFGKNYLGDTGFYTINLFGIPIVIGYEF